METGFYDHILFTHHFSKNSLQRISSWQTDSVEKLSKSKKGNLVLATVFTKRCVTLSFLFALKFQWRWFSYKSYAFNNNQICCQNKGWFVAVCLSVQWQLGLHGTIGFGGCCRRMDSPKCNSWWDNEISWLE